MFVTVAICTWNRASLLEKTLAEMRSLRIPAGVEWELLVVNNNCTDATDEVLARHAAKLPVRRLFESKPGQCHARNCAIAEARGELIIWTDDDVLVEPDWLAAYATAAQEQASAGFFGGPIRPWFESDPPAWLLKCWPKVQFAYATLEGRDTPGPIDASYLPYGANFAVRTPLQRAHLYDPSLGLRPGRTLRGDELDAMQRMLAAGTQGWWVANARVRHYIPENRMTLRYLRGYFYGKGQYDALAERSEQETSPLWFGRPRWLWRAAFESELRYRLTRILSQPDVWVNEFIKASTAWGRLATEKRVSQA